MAQGPIQVVLNTADYLQDEIVPPGGGSKDYFFGHNNDFAEHRDRLVDDVASMSAQLCSDPYSTIGYVKVRLKRGAWSKTNRPGRALFTKSQHCQIVGGGLRGEMIVAIDGNNVSSLLKAMSSAEIDVRERKDKNGKIEAAPTRKRSEVGAIETIELIGESDKCDLTPSAVLDWVQKRDECIYVELFEMPPTDYSGLSDAKVNLFESFRRGLESTSGIRVGRTSVASANMLVITILEGAPNIVSFNDRMRYDSHYTQSKDLKIYGDLLRFLLAHRLVKRISISPFVVSIAPSFKVDETEIAEILTPESKDYPIIGVIDSGISDIYKPWIKGSSDYIADIYREKDHATFISGLLVGGKSFNPTICKEEDGCYLVDLCMLPQKSVIKSYYYNMSVFCDKLEEEVRKAVEQHNVRVFNMSLNVEVINRKRSDYSELAIKLDEISVKYDVLFVISAGNLKLAPRRALWSTVPSDNIREISNRKDDIAVTPAESIRNISVGALNPDAFGLANYSRKGKASEFAVKPDFVYQSGSGIEAPGVRQGLYSVNAEGKITSSSGTSFSAPIVAKTLAVLDKSIAGRVQKETLLALMYHHAILPDSFRHKEYKTVLEEMIGYGVPKSAKEMLEGDEHSITLVFAEKIRKGMFFTFPFAWPRSLMKDGKCRGHIRITLVSSPLVDPSFESERVQENVSVVLRNGKKESIMNLLYNDSEDHESEENASQERVEEEHRWNPVKVYEKDLRGTSNAGDFNLVVRYKSRTLDLFSPNGVPFAVVLTISDNKSEAPVYEEMRNAIITRGAQISDIRTAARITQRV